VPAGLGRREVFARSAASGCDDLVKVGRHAACRNYYPEPMCRNIRSLHNYEPPASESEMREAALQYVRKISGSSKPSQANAAAFDRAVEEIAGSTARLLEGLVSAAPPKNREIEAAKRRERAQQRFAA
jgi:hypothetical protein